MRISGHRTLSVFQRYDITDERVLTKAARKQDAYFAEQKAKIRAERHDSP
jgi:hypothetical protein